jgi:hypothetical protein
VRIVRFGARAALALALTVQGAGAQVAAVSIAPPVLSPVGLWSAAAPTSAAAQANALTVRITSGAVQNIGFITDNTINDFPTPVVITTEWTLATLLTTVDLVGYFSLAGAALSNGTEDIGAHRILGRMTTGSPKTFSAFDESAVNGLGTPGGSLHLFRQLIVAPINAVGSRTDNLELQLDLRGKPKLSPGTYRGTLTLRAQAY